MATEIITRILCDVCNDDEGIPEAPDGRLVTIEIDGALRKIDLCSEHMAPIEGLIAMLERHGRHVPKRGRKAKGHAIDSETGRRLHPNEVEQMDCPIEDCDYTGTRKAVVQHVRSKHGTTLAELEGKPLNFACPDCDQRFALSQALGLHRRRAHGVDGSRKAS